MSDSRAEDYVRRFGNESWELDALDPRVMHDLIRAKVDALRDDALWQQNLSEEVADRRALDDVVRQFDAGGGGDPQD
jgi:hypothetical protein